MKDMEDDSDDKQEGDGVSSTQRIKIALIAVGAVAAFLLLAMVVRGSYLDEGGAPEPSSAEVAPAPAMDQPLEMRSLEIERLPVNFLGVEGEIIGSLFVNIGLSVGNAADEAYLVENLDKVRMAILEVLASEGIGRVDAPLEIDRDKVAALVIGAVNAALDKGVVLEVLVPDSATDG